MRKIISGKEFNEMIGDMLLTTVVARYAEDHPYCSAGEIVNIGLNVYKSFGVGKPFRQSYGLCCYGIDMLHTFCDYGNMLFTVEVPDDAKVYVESCGYLVDKLIILEETCIPKELCMSCVSKEGKLLKFIKEQTPELCIAAVRQNGWAFEFVKEQTPELCYEAVSQYADTIKFIKEQTPELCLMAVRNCGSTLQYIKDQTPEICLAAVQEYAKSLEWVKEQTPEVCIASVSQDGRNLWLVKNQTIEICRIAVQQNEAAIKYIEPSIIKSLLLE